MAYTSIVATESESKNTLGVHRLENETNYLEFIKLNQFSLRLAPLINLIFTSMYSYGEKCLVALKLGWRCKATPSGNPVSGQA